MRPNKPEAWGKCTQIFQLVTKFWSLGAALTPGLAGPAFYLPKDPLLKGLCPLLLFRHRDSVENGA